MYFFAHDKQEEAGSCVSHELELLTDVLDRGCESAVGPEVSLKPSVLLVKLDHTLGVGHDSCQFAPVSNNLRILRQSVQLRFGKPGDNFDVEVLEGFLYDRLLRLDYLPRDAVLEYGFCHDFQVIAKAVGLNSLRLRHVTLLPPRILWLELIILRPPCPSV